MINRFENKINRCAAYIFLSDNCAASILLPPDIVTSASDQAARYKDRNGKSFLLLL